MSQMKHDEFQFPFPFPFPIRRFCPAWEDESHPLLLPASPPPSPSPSSLDHPSHLYDLVDTFINLDPDTPPSHVDNSPFDDSLVLHLLPPLRVSSPAHLIEPGVDQGLLLVHSLLACAEAVGCRDTQLARSLLSQLWPSISPTGNSLQRVSYYFAVGLNARLLLLHNASVNGNCGMTSDMINDAIRYPTATIPDKMDALRLLHQTTPYISFPFLAANDAILLAAQGKDSLHIIDLGVKHSFQWPSLLHVLGSREEGAPKCIRITGIVSLIRETDDYLITELKSSGQQLVDIATSVGIASLEYDLIMEELTPSLFTKEKLKVREGEAVFVNSIMQLHRYVKESRGYLKAILQAMKRLEPTLMTVVEQDANHNGPFFMGRFLESLHYYSAIFDSLEASLPRESPERAKIERFHYAEEIRNIVANEGTERVERHERADQWRRQLGRAGFQGVGLKGMGEATAMVSGYGCEGYTVALEKGCLLLGWEGRPIMSASAWQVQHSSRS
ncbi:hypothetical protein MLD38_027054 [Melastoma candidum]|uniref:Uncharacterized protein n=1 Tax=Melastoma candidum TaxID=119954 RepID=A0ACB9P3M7_9MYRT|nr:hypothetical protein MLD38_027054 [Melastoma candidum]